MNEKITGKFEHIIFRHDESYFTVARFVLQSLDEKNIIVTGYLPTMDQDFLYDLEGNYIEHPKYGMQFSIQTYRRVMPNDVDSLVRYLSSPVFAGICKKLAERIVDLLGNDCIEKIKDNPNCLDEIPKMTDKKKQTLVDGLSSEHDSFEEVLQFFTTHGLGIRNIIRLNRAYGKDSIEKISENPYRVIEELDGFGFKTADKIALSMGYELDHPYRIEAYLATIVMDMCMRTGDSYVVEETIKKEFNKRLGGIDANFDEYCLRLLKKRRIVKEDDRIYPVSQFDAESGISTFLNLFPYEKIDPYNKDLLEESLQEIQEKLNIQYDPKQMEALNQFFNEDFMILTGGPGTGKTTVVRGMVSIFKKLYPLANIACCAPTGRAAKRLAELTEVDTYTIHSLLLWDLESNTFGKNENEPLFIDLLIVDEFSMVDNWLFYNLVKACVHVKKICLIGDENQLPSVSPGCLLKDLIESSLFPVVRLEHIFRQQEGSDVIELANQIRKGYLDFTKLNQDVAFFETNQFGVKDRVVHIVQQALDKGYELKDIQILACMYQGVAGIDRLNNALQACFNPPSKDRREWKVGYRIFREEDKILQLKNQPDDDVYNGDIGRLVEIIYPQEDPNNTVRLIVDYEGIFVEYSPENFERITHAYCISVHKSQGSEYPIVIFPIVEQHRHMLQRSLLYTAITRAKKSLVLLGSKSVSEEACKTEVKRRETTLIKRLTGEE
ncbi:SF1B family DNA helicase RecD2 [Anaerorhabdus sp.]|uniref:SF1B family DNA helicase RecD2 n=1 Tax=Anaerorhabdus sp. TaxID=1872524 RepID=UPI002FC62328